MQDSVTERVTSCTKTTGVEVDHVFLQYFREWMSMSSVDELNKELSFFKILITFQVKRIKLIF